MVRLTVGSVMVSLTLVDIGILVALSSTIIGASAASGRAMITRTVTTKVDEKVDDKVDDAMELVQSKLDAIRLNQRENSEAFGRLSALEVTVKNGLSKRIERIEKQVDRLVDHQLGNDERR